MPRVRKLIAIPALAVGALVIGWFVFAWLGFDPLVRWALPKWVGERSGHALKIERASLDPWKLAVAIDGLALTSPSGAPMLAVGRVFADFAVGASLVERAWVLDELRVSAPVAGVELRADGHVDWLEFVAALSGPPPAEPPPTQAEPRLLLRHSVLERGRVEFTDRRVEGGFHTSVDALDLELDEISTLPEHRGELSLSARTGIGAKLRWKGTLELNPVVASGEFAVDELLLERLWPYLKPYLDMAPPAGQVAARLSYRLTYADKKLNLVLDGVQAGIEHLVLRGNDDAEPPIAIDSLQARGGHFDLARREISLEALRAEGGHVAINLDASSRPRLLDWARQRRAATAAAAAEADAGSARWQYKVGRIEADRLALHVLDRAFVTPLTVDIGRFGVGFTADGQIGGDLRVGGFGLRLADVRIGSQGRADPWLALAGVAIDGGELAFGERRFELERTTLQGGRLVVVRDAGGGVPLLAALRRAPRVDGGAPAPEADAGKGWQYRLARLAADDFEVALRDEAVAPAARLDASGLRFELQGLSDKLDAWLPLKLGFDVRQGGRFAADGRVALAPLGVDLQVKLTGLALLPAQPYVGQRVALRLASGSLGTQGRVRVQRGEFRYEGSAAVDALRLDGEGDAKPLFGWKRLATDRLLVAPGQVRLGEIGIDGLLANLVIFEDHSVNVARLVKRRADPAPEPNAAAAQAPLRVDVERIHVTNGDVDFADLSLALPFGARIHDLKGDLVGLSSQPGGAMQLELDGVVGDWGLARAAGQVQPFDPTSLLDIKVVFRNVEMNRLTPYAATFAGRRIESGKLALDLEYKIRDRQLSGDNRVVMERLQLGEHVQSASAANLPLDLAVAILEDSDGVIDLGLPVSGSLDDPKFSFGGIVWKAFVNVLTKIVSAPFRAIGAMLGIGGDELGKIAFDPGSAALLPPEREKLAKLAEAMTKRPALAIGVAGSFDPASDANAIKALRLRRALAAGDGRTLAPDEDPGPISTARPATQKGLEALYTQRFGAEALASLQQAWQQANPAPPPSGGGGQVVSRLSPTSKAAPSAPAEEARLRGADLHALLLQRLLDADHVDDVTLQRLGRERGEAIRREFSAHGIAPERIGLDAPKAQPGGGAAVTTALRVEAVARKAEPAATGS